MKKAELRQGFTLVEILVVVVILGVIAAIVIPAFSTSAEDATSSVFTQNMRIARNAFNLYFHEHEAYPPDRLPAVFPEEMGTHLSRESWVRETSLGGNWDWDYLQFGTTAGVSVHTPTCSTDRLVEVDTLLDDGNLEVGSFRRRTDGYISVIAE